MESAPTLEFIEAMERAVLSGDRAAAARYLDGAVVYTVGALPPVPGIDAIIAYVMKQSSVARWDGHTLKGAWSMPDGLIVEVQSHFTRLSDSRLISLPCVDIYRFKAERIVDWRVYADLSIFHQHT